MHIKRLTSHIRLTHINHTPTLNKPQLLPLLRHADQRLFPQ
ncbi:hypothetical protein [uncultured Gammaproteobacteria bacterium]|nr:hypothetical protein [uncultured Gammaproteobacteria bacterium]CAC9968325.1 hypothetical protein [uncultured Gammaproteobacteria bacterium]